MATELWHDDFGQPVRVHAECHCRGESCSIHNPSEHSMSGFKRYWRYDRGLMERICPHGVGHPDPDHLAFVRKIGGDAIARTEGVHGCDGCCV